MSALRKFKVRVRTIHYEAEDIRSYVLMDPDGAQLPEFKAGAHIDLHLENGLIRQYSLCNSSWERRFYLIGVLLEHPGTGGSEYIFNNIQVGDLLEISEPKHLFKLSSNAQRHLLIAGGIGITPILSMAYTLEQEKADYVFHYCTRAPEKTAYREEVENLVRHGSLQFHFDGGNPENGLDLKVALQEYQDGTHLYYCGPAPMMKAASEASAHWPSGTVHFEYFSAEGLETATPDSREPDAEFQIRLASSGSVYTVPAHKTIVDVLMENGIFVDTSCEDGFCGTCLTRYLEGEPEHRDEILDDEDHEEYLLICCARSRSPELLLDL